MGRITRGNIGSVQVPVVTQSAVATSGMRINAKTNLGSFIKYASSAAALVHLIISPPDSEVLPD